MILAPAKTHLQPVALSEFAFAKYLRKHNAIDNWSSTAEMNKWYNERGETVAAAIYNNAASTARYFLNLRIFPL